MAMCETREELGFLPLMSSTSMNAVDTRPCDVVRQKTLAHQQMPLRGWPLTVLEKYPALADLRCV